ncbi:sortase [Clavibacter zhangzhiyongii]|uniref:sortase n=1 Tax=Clavibacter TaxID=1573 RepID=UPI0039E18C96
MDGLAAASLIIEFLTWIALVPGIVLYVAGVSVRVLGRRWTATEGLVADGPADADGSSARVLRWFDGDGEVHEASADSPETRDLAAGSDVRVWFSPRAPWRVRTHAPELDGRALRVTGLVLIGIGASAAVAGIALLFLE